MASNYRNSAGTDLDNLFYVCNANSGNIGFKVSDGTDLGVRYGGGTLGYNVGYKNSAGTDLGYLRGTKKIATTTIKVGTYDDYYGYDYITDLFSRPFGSASPNTVFGCQFALFYVTTGLTDFFITSNAYFNKSFTFTRLDSMKTFTGTVDNTIGKRYAAQVRTMFFSSSDVGKNIPVKIEINN